MKKKSSLMLAGAAALCAAAPAVAHHSVAMFDMTQHKTMQGTVRAWQWTNPHAWLQVVGPNGQGGQAEMGFELGSPNTLVRDGFKRDTFKPGDVVTVIYAPRRDSAPGGHFLCGKVRDGKWFAFGPGCPVS